MRTQTIRPSTLLGFALLLAGCDTAQSPAAVLDDGAFAASRAAEACVNVAVETSGVLGLWMHDGVIVFGWFPGRSCSAASPARWDRSSTRSRSPA